MTTRAMAAGRLLGAAAGADLAMHAALVGALPLRGSVRPGRLGPLDAVVAAAGLRGRGGGWFPFVRKLRAVAAATGSRPPVVVANGMEGEPLSEKDTYLLAHAPHLVMDGAALAAEAIGASRIILAVPAAAAGGWPDGGGRRHMITSMLRSAADARRRRRIDPVRIEVLEGPRRYLSGQETALVNWINGGPPLPTATRPFVKGVAGRATLIGNVETFAQLALIARYGPEWYRAAGTPEAPGTTLVTVSGAVVRPGVLEVPVGTPIGEVLRAADAVADPAAVLVGGYGGAWLDGAAAGAHALDPESMAAAGAALGPGIVHVLPRGERGLDRTAEIARWMAGESAGQCGPCRFGLRALSTDLELALRGAFCADGVFGETERLRRRLALLSRRGGCAHPDGVARLVASALAVFGSEATA
jgi:NADH:ubiquinone oxidoreductase subunit F (NADH-binding)